MKNPMPKANSTTVNTSGTCPHKMTLQYWLLFYELVFLFLLKVYCFEKWKILEHFIKYHKKEPFSQTLVCCYIMA